MLLPSNSADWQLQIANTSVQKIKQIGQVLSKGIEATWQSKESSDLDDIEKHVSDFWQIASGKPCVRSKLKAAKKWTARATCYQIIVAQHADDYIITVLNWLEDQKINVCILLNSNGSRIVPSTDVCLFNNLKATPNPWSTVLTLSKVNIGLPWRR